jgi:hypothetical protein
MTMQATPHTWWPAPYGIPLTAISSALSLTSNTFDSATDRLAYVGTASRALTITEIYFLTATVTTGCVVDVRIETVTNGRPTNTLWATTTNGAVTIAAADDNVWKTATLTSSATINAGDQFAIVIRYSSGTNATFASQQNIGGNAGATYPLQLVDTGAGTWANLSGQWCWIVASSSTPVYTPGLIPFSAANQTAFNSGSAADEYAMRFVFPFKARLIGCSVGLSNIAAGADFRIFLWGTGGASDTEAGALASTPVIDGDSVYATTSDGSSVFYFSAPYEVTAGSTYYLGVRAETANNLAIISWPIAASAPANAINASPSGAECYLSTRAWSAINPGTVGAWTNATTTVPAFRLIFDQADDGASAGSGGIRLAGHGGFAA